MNNDTNIASILVKFINCHQFFVFFFCCILFQFEFYLYRYYIDKYIFYRQQNKYSKYFIVLFPMTKIFFVYSYITFMDAITTEIEIEIEIQKHKQKRNMRKNCNKHSLPLCVSPPTMNNSSRKIAFNNCWINFKMFSKQHTYLHIQFYVQAPKKMKITLFVCWMVCLSLI